MPCAAMAHSPKLYVDAAYLISNSQRYNIYFFLFYSSILILAEGNMLLCSRCQLTMYKFFYFKIEIKTKVDLYMPCKAMAHSPSSITGHSSCLRCLQEVLRPF